MENFDESLLTAYLDNELSEAERAFVDEQLAANPQLTELLDELRQVRSLVQLLSNDQISADLTSGVLSRAKQISLEANQTHSDTSLRLPTETFSTSHTRTIARPWWSSTQLKWVAALATAACLLIIFVRPQGLDPKVAMSPKGIDSTTPGFRSNEVDIAPTTMSLESQPSPVLLESSTPSSSQMTPNEEDRLLRRSVAGARGGGVEDEPTTWAGDNAVGNSDPMNMPGGFGGGDLDGAGQGGSGLGGSGHGGEVLGRAEPEAANWGEAQTFEKAQLGSTSANDADMESPRYGLELQQAGKAPASAMRSRNIQPSVGNTALAADAPADLNDNRTADLKKSSTPATLGRSTEQSVAAAKPDSGAKLFRYKQVDSHNNFFFDAQRANNSETTLAEGATSLPSLSFENKIDGETVKWYSSNVELNSQLLESLGFVPALDFVADKQLNKKDVAKTEEWERDNAQLSDSSGVLLGDREKVTLVIDGRYWDDVRQSFAQRGITLQEVALEEPRKLAETNPISHRPPRLENPTQLGTALIIKIEQPTP